MLVLGCGRKKKGLTISALVRGTPCGNREQEVGSFCVFSKHFISATHGRSCCSHPGVATVKPGHGNSNLCQNRSPRILVCFCVYRGKTKSLFRFSLTGTRKEEDSKYPSIFLNIPNYCLLLL